MLNRISQSIRKKADMTALAHQLARGQNHQRAPIFHQIKASLPHLYSLSMSFLLLPAQALLGIRELEKPPKCALPTASTHHSCFKTRQPSLSICLPNAHAKPQRLSFTTSQIAIIAGPWELPNCSSKSQIVSRHAAFWHAIGLNPLNSNSLVQRPPPQ